VGKPYNAANARHVDFSKFSGRGAAMVVDIGDVGQDVSELQRHWVPLMLASHEAGCLIPANSDRGIRQ